MKKRISRAILLMLCLEVISYPYSKVFAQETCEDTINVEEMVVRANSREWKYKIIDGKLYRRLFDATNGKWIGEWELVG